MHPAMGWDALESRVCRKVFPLGGCLGLPWAALPGVACPCRAAGVQSHGSAGTPSLRVVACQACL